MYDEYVPHLQTDLDFPRLGACSPRRTRTLYFLSTSYQHARLRPHESHKESAVQLGAE
jgi:hypothetical protein